MKARFNIGDKVTAIALPDAFPKAVAAVTELVVSKVTLIEDSCPCESHRMKPYYRVLAYKPDGLGCVEGAERFFEAA